MDRPSSPSRSPPASRDPVVATLRDATGTPLAIATVVETALYSLIVDLTPNAQASGAAPSAPLEAHQVTLMRGDRSIEIGRCEYVPHAGQLRRRATDPPPPLGTGRLVPLETVIDFRAILEKGVVVPLAQRARQLPLVFRRKEQVVRQFREYTSDVGYDVQVFRSLLDEIDRSIEHEPPDVAEKIRSAAIGEQWRPFCALFDRGLAELEALTASFSRQAHELHGFYFRKHMWDIILCSQFLTRTNIKPRGYAGDSEMMRMCYEDRFVGPTVFSRFMHRHPIRTDAAQAVRNRRGLIAELIGGRVAQRPNSTTRVMSVACGPAAELVDVVSSPDIARRVSLLLLDQDREALAQAERGVAAISARLDAPIDVRFVRDSVRTMLRSTDLQERWGSFDLIYTMGLFDYLAGNVAEAVLTRLYRLLAPGGELIVGNFHVANKTRVYMEYWMDWVLFYRAEEEMLALTANLPGAAASLSFEDTKSQMFLRVQKPS